MGNATVRRAPIGELGFIFGRNVWQREHDESLRFVARLRELLEKYPS